jgi:hypothetical protein
MIDDDVVVDDEEILLFLMFVLLIVIVSCRFFNFFSFKLIKNELKNHLNNMCLCVIRKIKIN